MPRVLIYDEAPPPQAPRAPGKFLIYDEDPGAQASEAPSAAPDATPAPTPGEQALEGMPGWQRALVGTGKAFSDTWHGVKQFGAEAANAVSPELVSDEAVRDLRAEADETKERDQALMDDTAGRAGNIGGHVAMGVALPAKRLLTAIGSAVGYGAAQPVGTEESRTENAVTSGALGGTAGGVAKVVGRALKPVRSEVSRGIDKLMDYAEAKGFKLSAGQRTGSRHLQNAEAALDTLPTSGSPLGKYRDHNQQTANRIVAKEMGEEADAVTPEVIEGARTRIGGVMDSLTKARQFDVDHKFFDDVFRIRAQYGQTLKGQQSAQIRSMIDELATGSKLRKPQITAEQYQRTASELKQEAEAAFRSGTGVADAKVKRELANALEDLAERNFTGEELAAFQEARRQYSATLIAEKAVRPDGSGDIMIEKVAGATKKHRRVATRQGTTDELVELGRLGQGLKKQLIPNSGTAERSWWLQALQNPIGHAGLGYAGLGPIGAVGALSMPWLAGRAMYSGVGQNWLRNGVPNTNLLREALSRTGPGVATGVVASGESAR
jgi:hypothetical protein